MIEISRTYTFDAAHHLPNVPDGHKCKRPHGHTYRLQLWIKGPVDMIRGWIMDYAELDKIWEQIADRVDHRDLNTVLPNPTTEALVEWLYVEIHKLLPAYAAISELVLHESVDSSCRLRVEFARQP